MKNSDLLAGTSYGKNNGENTITTIERLTIPLWQPPSAAAREKC